MDIGLLSLVLALNLTVTLTHTHTHTHTHTVRALHFIPGRERELCFHPSPPTPSWAETWHSHPKPPAPNLDPSGSVTVDM